MLPICLRVNWTSKRVVAHKLDCERSDPQKDGTSCSRAPCIDRMFYVLLWSRQFLAFRLTEVKSDCQELSDVLETTKVRMADWCDG